MRHKPELDGIRGLAILGVLATHSAAYIEIATATKPLLVLMYVGQWGVDLFFALSGFLITGILLDTKTATNFLRSFYARRILRIWPVYYSVLIILFSLTLVEPWVANNMPGRHEWGSYFLYLQNVPWFWTNGYVVAPTMVGHFWSLAVEEQFYLVWPFVVLLVSEDAMLIICAAGFIAALPLRIYLLRHVFGTSWAEMIITTARMDGLFVGAAYALVLHRWKRLSLRVSMVPGLAGMLILVWIVAFHYKHEFIGSGPYMRTYGVTAVALVAGALIGLSQQRLQLVNRILNMGWLGFLGRYSYGIYVFHIPIFLAASHGVAMWMGLRLPLPILQAVPFILAINGVSILAAVISFECFESRILRMKSRFKPRFQETESGQVSSIGRSRS